MPTVVMNQKVQDGTSGLHVLSTGKTMSGSHEDSGQCPPEPPQQIRGVGTQPAPQTMPGIPMGTRGAEEVDPGADRNGIQKVEEGR